MKIKLCTYTVLWYTGTFFLFAIVYLGSIVLGANPMLAFLLALASVGTALLRVVTYKSTLDVVSGPERWWHIYGWMLCLIVQSILLGCVIVFGVKVLYPFIDGWNDHLF